MCPLALRVRPTKPSSRNGYTAAKADKSPTFVCEICLKRFPRSARDIHHRLMQACGGTDDPINLCYCDNGCHQTIHRIGLLLASTKQGKASPEEEATMFARSVNEDSWSQVKDNLLQLAVQIAVAVSSQRNGLIAVQETDVVIPNVPPRLRKALMELGNSIKNANGRGIGMSGVAIVGALEKLIKHRPEMQREAFDFLQQRYNLTTRQSKQLEAATKAMADAGINLKSHA